MKMKKFIILLSVISLMISNVSCGSRSAEKEYTADTFQRMLNYEEKNVSRTEPASTVQNTRELVIQDPAENKIEIIPGTIYDTNGIPILYTDLDSDNKRMFSPEYSECFSNILSSYSSGLESQPKYREVLMSQNPTLVKDKRVGKSAVVTYDAKIQKSLYEYCKGMNINGSLVIMRSDGSLVAEVSSPSYNANEYIDALNNGEANSLSNGCLNNKCEEHRAPGSTFKMISALTAKIANVTGDTVEPGVFYDGGYWDTPDGFRVRDWFFTDNGGFSAEGPRNRNISDAFIISSNVVFAKTFVALGASQVDSLLKQHFCFGVPIEMDMVTFNASNQLGIEDGSDRSLALSAFGQGKCATSPLYLTILTREAICGDMVKAFTMKNVVDTSSPDKILDAGSTPCEVIANTGGITMKEEMRAIANDLVFSLDGYTLYCKTGTAEVDNQDDTLYIAAYLEQNGKEFKFTDTYADYKDYASKNGSYFIVLQVRNPHEINFEWPNRNAIYASHMGPILNHIAFLVTSND
ncbi:MAG: hypothetical protein K5979_12420 [Ruminococcus sp.]|nr:hypothetical protein [Ruminococcus sp.]